MPHDGPIVHEQQVRDGAKPLARLVFVNANGFIAEIAAGGHHRDADQSHQQMMQRRVRQEYAQVRIPRRHQI